MSLINKAESDGVEFKNTNDKLRIFIPQGKKHWEEIIHERMSELEAHFIGETPGEKQSLADLLVELAMSRYRFGRTDSDDAFAVELGGPNVAIMLRGSGDSLRSKLSREFRKIQGRTPNSSALTDALTALQGEAFAAEPEAVFLRVAEFDGSIVIDLGNSTGNAIVVKGGAWEVSERSPVLFRRTATTSSLPIPENGGTLAEFRDLLNVTAETWPLVIGWIVAAYVPGIPHPILLLGGQQGTGKTTAAEKFKEIVDPSPAPLQNQPRDSEQWAICAAASHVVGVDNVSTLSPWWSDALCKAVTGDGWLRRKLYTDGEVSVSSFKRAVLLTSIDAGALRGDLGDRVLLVDLESIGEVERRTKTEIDLLFKAAKPRIFGAILDLLAKVLQVLPNIHLEKLPRMADFAKLLAAVDQVNDDRDKNDNLSLDIYLGQRDRIAETVIESDDVAIAIQALAETEGTWTGTANELLKVITPEKPPRGWPQNCNALGGRIKRLGPALDQVGVCVFHHPRSGKRREITISEKRGEEVVTPVTMSQTLENKGLLDDDLVTSGDKDGKAAKPVVTEECPVFPEENGSYDESDKDDKEKMTFSDPDQCKMCRSTDCRDVPIHGGNSIRRECARCGHHIRFVEWNTV
ncbi:ATP-binding protein [Bythopirellula polymerisocia]|nr:ATP-binding protein [Bythopirellula polymerisocia]